MIPSLRGSEGLLRWAGSVMWPPHASSCIYIKCWLYIVLHEVQTDVPIWSRTECQKKICWYTRLNVLRNVRVSVKHARRLSLHANFESRVDKGMKRLIKDTAPSLTLTQLAKMVRNAFECRIMKRRQLKEKGRRLTQISRKPEQEPRGRFGLPAPVCKRVCDYSSLPK